MNPQQAAAVASCTPRFASWHKASLRFLEQEIADKHPKGERAFIRSAAIVSTRTGVREVRRGVDVLGAGARVGTRLWYLNPNNTVAIVDDWN